MVNQTIITPTMKNEHPETGKIYVGIKWICQGIGLSKTHIERQRRNISKDRVLSKGEANMPLLTKGGRQDVLCIELGYLPLWLAKISITPGLLKSHPEVASRLEEYQIKAKDVLAQHFIKKNMSIMVPATFPEALRLAANLAEENLKNRKLIAEKSVALEESIESNQRKIHIINKMTPKVQALYDLMFVKNMIDLQSYAKKIGVGPYRIFSILRDMGILMGSKGRKNLPYQQYVNSGYIVNHIVEKRFHNESYFFNKPLLTGKGFAWLTKTLRKKGFIKKELPDIEKIVQALENG
ncbi:MAG: phage antirepressor KilAC domain-containing protein [Armatimonadetes bacterium]|nr:phage antirepressor KilAC domain-containing protein [Armatimonadota bacterium]